MPLFFYKMSFIFSYIFLFEIIYPQVMVTHITLSEVIATIQKYDTLSLLDVEFSFYNFLAEVSRTSDIICENMSLNKQTESDVPYMICLFRSITH